ncbi:MAG: hypothetical protein GEU98_01495 [Pseudonocardiaceae bacterium]|nr:hypothetical protein [Pseudonocardiaceae bacterium]
MTANLRDKTHQKTMKTIARQSFCTLATTSPAHRPHVAGVIYQAVDLTFYVSTMRSSRKARNIAENPRVGVCIPIRRMPVGPPSSVQFQAVAEILAVDDSHIVRLAEAGQLKSITGHGELHEPDGCFIRITPPRRVNTYGIGMPIIQLLRDPLHAAGAIELIR